MYVPIYAIAYLLLLLGEAAASVTADHRGGIPAWRLVLDVAATLVLAGLFVAFYRPELTDILGRVTAALLLVAVLVSAVGTHTRIQRHETDPELSARRNLAMAHIGILLDVLVVSPAIVCGALAAARAW